MTLQPEEKLIAELVFALKNLLATKRGEGGTVYNSDEIAEVAIAKALSYRPDGVGGEDKMARAANEWADAFYNALQWIKNIRDGQGDAHSFDEAITNLDYSAEHCQAVWTDARLARLPALPVEGGAVHGSLPPIALLEAEASAEAWCCLAGEAIDALDALAGWERPNAWDHPYGDMTQFAEAAVSAMRRKYPPVHQQASMGEARTWPDWRTMPKDAPIEHIRSDGDRP